MLTRNRFRSIRSGAIVFLIVWALSVSTGLAQEECVECHSDQTATRTLPSGAVQSLYVDLKVQENSVHAGFSCVECHTDLKGFSDWPHPEFVKKANCSGCHEEVASQVALGGHELKLKCADCHGTHDILSPSNPRSTMSKSKVNETCENCHNALHPPLRGRSTAYARYEIG